MTSPRRDLERLRQQHSIAGISAAAIKDGEVAWAAASGALPAGTNTLFQAGSISKPVTAFGALRLVEAGLLQLDTDVNDLLTSWAIPSVAGWQPRVTPRMLLTHLAGLSVGGFPGYPVAGNIPSAVDVLAGKGNTPPVAPEGIPGLWWRYSGGGTTVLQQLMEDVTGERFPELMRRLVLEPAGMENSTFEQPLPAHYHATAATGHIGPVPVEGRWHVYPEMAAAGLWTTATDLARFALEIVAAHRPQPGALLKPASASELLNGQDAAPGMGLGLFLSTEPPLVFAHAGGDHGFVCDMACAADGSVGAVALTNQDTGMAAADEVLSLTGRERNIQLPPDWKWVNELSEAEARNNADEPLPPGGPVVSGPFQIRQTRILVKQSGELIQITFGDQPPLDFYNSDGYWRAQGLKTTVRFLDGKLAIRQFGRELFATRIQTNRSPKNPRR